MTKTLKERFDEEDKKTWRTCTPNGYFSTETILRIVENWLTDHIQDCSNNYCNSDALNHLLTSLCEKNSRTDKK